VCPWLVFLLERVRGQCSSLERVLAHGECPLSRALLGRLDGQLVLGEGAADGACLLGTQVLGLEALVLVELAQVLLLCLVDDCEHARDGLAHVTDLGELRGRAAGNLGNPQLRQLRLQLIELLNKFILLFTPKVFCLNLAHVYRSEIASR